MSKRFPWFFSLLWLLILMVMIWAGFWQLDRAKQKEHLEANMSSATVNKPTTKDQWDRLSPFEKLTFAGRYHDLHFALDNQIMDGRVGQFLFTAFQTVEGFWVLVNRGWFSEAIDIHSPSTDQEITGMVASWPRPGYKMGEQVLNNAKIQSVTYLEYDQVSSLLRERLCEQNGAKDCIILPLTIKLDPGMPFGYKRDWQLPRMTAEKHRAYSLQWFTMSLVLILIYGVFMRKVYANKN